jgi:hypothetical protein
MKTKRKLTPPKAQISGNGLTADDTDALKAVLKEIDAIAPRLHLLGGADRAKVLAADARIKLRLVPHAPADLIAQARQLIDQFQPTLDASRKRALELEANMAAIAAQRQAHAEAIAKQRAERLEQQRLRHRGMNT